jgi:ATP-dependent Lon protease
VIGRSALLKKLQHTMSERDAGVKSEKTLDDLIVDAFDEVSVDKGLVRELNLESQGVPTFVAEWLIDRERRRNPHESLDQAQSNIHGFIQRHLPRKSQKEAVKNRLQNGEVIRILDKFEVVIDLKKDEKRVLIPSIDTKGRVSPHVVNKYSGLLEGGLWGAGKLAYERPSNRRSGDGSVMLHEFRPLQAADIKLEYYCQQRSRFTTDQWIALLLRSMGYNPSFYTKRETRIWLLTRLLPLVQKRVNMIELAPKGTGKSFVFSNLSRYSRVISGGKTSPAVLFYNMNTSRPGLLTQYDVLVFDEAQTISFNNPDEVIGILKDYMESGKFTRGDKHASSNCGVTFLGNIEIGGDGLPVAKVLFDQLPDFLGEAAFIDRIHALLPGWEIPKIQKQSPAKSAGLKADYFAEVLRKLRDEGRYDSFVSSRCQLSGDGAGILRNNKAIKRLATGYLKLFFPDLEVSSKEFAKYCLKPAIELRERVCDQLHLIDSGEYGMVSISGSFRS